MQYDKNHSKDSIRLNDHLIIEVESAWYTRSSGMFMGSYCYLNYFMMIISTHVDGIKMATYNFKLDIKDNHELYREWECEKKEIFHYMPNQFIDLMNKWSREIVSEFDEKRNEKKRLTTLKQKEKYDNEENILNKYR